MWTLDLEYNNISELDLDALKGLSNTVWLSLRGNHIESLPVGAFAGTPASHHLNLRENLIENLPAGAFAGTSVQFLDLRDNRLALSSAAAAFRNLTDLVFLWLDGNDKMLCDSGSFPELPHLEALAMNHMSLVNCTKGYFVGLPALTYLGLINTTTLCGDMNIPPWATCVDDRSEYVCVDVCSSMNRNDCDDGGPGAGYDGCPLGTDCGTCGRRYI